jgi:hypothetical protein
VIGNVTSGVPGAELENLTSVLSVVNPQRISAADADPVNVAVSQTASTHTDRSTRIMFFSVANASSAAVFKFDRATSISWMPRQGAILQMTFHRFRILPFLLVSAITMVLTEGRAEACVCPTPSTLEEARTWATAVFIAKAESTTTINEGKKDDAPAPSGRKRFGGRLSGGRLGGGTFATTTTFSVSTVFRGPEMRRFETTDRHSSCDVHFTRGETYLIYASGREGALSVDKCNRTRPLSAAASDLQYLEGLRDDRPQGVVAGYVWWKVVGRDGLKVNGRREETLDIIVVGGGRTRTMRSEPWGSFHLVLPPGEYDIRVERAGKQLAPVRGQRLTNGMIVKHEFIVDQP